MKRIADFAYEERQAPQKMMRSDFALLRLDPDQADALKQILLRALRAEKVVMKRRRVYFNERPTIGEELKINLDKVDGLGDFVEFELRVKKGEISEGKRYLKRLMREVEIREKNLIALTLSYYDAEID